MSRSRIFTKLISIAAALVLAVSFALPAAAYNDDSKVRNAEAVRLVTRLGIMDGYTDGSFRPAGLVTRAEAAALLSRAFWGGEDESGLYLDGNPGGYSDITGHWAAGYINYCTVLGIFTGSGDGRALPNGYVRTVEFYKLALAALGYSAAKEGYTGADWASNILDDASAAGLDSGVSAGAYDSLTRDDAALILRNLLYANIVVYSHNTPTFVPSGVSVLNYTGAVGGTGDGWRTFGMEHFAFRTVTGVLAANGYAVLAGVPSRYNEDSFSVSPNGVTTLGGLLRTDGGQWVELKDISLSLSLLGRAVTAELAGNDVLSVSLSPRNVETGITGLAADAPLPENCEIYVNCALAGNGEAELVRAIQSGENVTLVSTDGDAFPEYIFIDRWQYAGKLDAIGSMSYPGYGRACRFSLAGTRYSNFMIGTYSVGMYANIRQVGRYTFVDKTGGQTVSAGTSAGVALITGISAVSGENASMSVYAVLETGAKGVYSVAGVSLDGEFTAAAALLESMSAEKAAGVALGSSSIPLKYGTAANLCSLVGYTLSDAGALTLSPTFDKTGAQSSVSQLTVYSDYSAGGVTFGLGPDGNSRSVAMDTVIFLESADGWTVCRGEEIPSLVKSAGAHFITALYANMFSVSGSDGLKLRAAVVPSGVMTLDRRSEYEFYVVVDLPVLRDSSLVRPIYDFSVFDGTEVRRVFSDIAPQRGGIYRTMTESDGGFVLLSGDSFACGDKYAGAIRSYASGVLCLGADAPKLFLCGGNTLCYLVDGANSRAVETDRLNTFLGRRAVVVGADGGSASLVFVCK